MLAVTTNFALREMHGGDAAGGDGRKGKSEKGGKSWKALIKETGRGGEEGMHGGDAVGGAGRKW